MTITLNPRALFGFAVGLAIAAIAFFAFQSMTADAVDEGESTFVGVTPCRLFDTRPGGVGLRSTPLGADETHDFQVTGTNGDCTIPGDATGISINLTGVGPTANTNLRVFPAGAAVPNAAAVNMQAGQGPTPNKLDVKLSSDGKVAVFNRFGSIDVIGDVMGYYRSDGLTDLETRLAALEAAATGQDAKIAALEAAKTSLEADVAALETKLASVTIETVDGQPTVRFTGVNVQVVDGSGDTAGAVNGLGNLIVGYNENLSDTRTGSHNVVIGELHTYSSYGGFVAGFNNTISGVRASITAGIDGVASGTDASITGGWGNTASGERSWVSGCSGCTASGFNAAISAGTGNTATAAYSSVSGGQSNSATGVSSSVSGGGGNSADQGASSVSGGSARTVSGLGGDGFDWVGGGLFQDF